MIDGYIHNDAVRQIFTALPMNLSDIPEDVQIVVGNDVQMHFTSNEQFAYYGQYSGPSMSGKGIMILRKEQ